MADVMTSLNPGLRLMAVRGLQMGAVDTVINMSGQA